MEVVIESILQWSPVNRTILFHKLGDDLQALNIIQKLVSNPSSVFQTHFPASSHFLDEDSFESSKSPSRKTRKLNNQTHENPNAPVSLNNQFDLLQNENMDEETIHTQPSTSSYTFNGTNISQSQKQKHIINAKINSRRSEQPNQATPSDINQQPPEQKNPPLTIKDKTSRNTLKKLITSENIKVKHILNKRDGFQTFPKQSDDHRKLTKLLDVHHQAYFTYRLPDEKTLRVVPREIPLEIESDYVKEILSEKFDIVNLHRMYRKNNIL